jgi:hypothetical protein
MFVFAVRALPRFRIAYWRNDRRHIVLAPTVNSIA